MSAVTLNAPDEMYWYSYGHGSTKVFITNLKVIYDSEGKFTYIVKFTERVKESVQVDRHKWWHYLLPFRPFEWQERVKQKTLYMPRAELDKERKNKSYCGRYIDEDGNRHRYSLNWVFADESCDERLEGLYPHNLIAVCCDNYFEDEQRKRDLEAIKEVSND
jgi:hypothetical protein